MSLRRCPSCRNMISTETPQCPICGCNPVARWVARAIALSVVLAATGWMLHHWMR